MPAHITHMSQNYPELGFCARGVHREVQPLEAQHQKMWGQIGAVQSCLQQLDEHSSQTDPNAAPSKFSWKAASPSLSWCSLLTYLTT